MHDIEYQNRRRLLSTIIRARQRLTKLFQYKCFTHFTTPASNGCKWFVVFGDVLWKQQISWVGSTIVRKRRTLLRCRPLLLLKYRRNSSNKVHTIYAGLLLLQWHGSWRMLFKHRGFLKLPITHGFSSSELFILQQRPTVSRSYCSKATLSAGQWVFAAIPSVARFTLQA